MKRTLEHVVKRVQRHINAHLAVDCHEEVPDTHVLLRVAGLALQGRVHVHQVINLQTSSHPQLVSDSTRTTAPTCACAMLTAAYERSLMGNLSDPIRGKRAYFKPDEARLLLMRHLLLSLYESACMSSRAGQMTRGCFALPLQGPPLRFTQMQPEQEQERAHARAQHVSRAC